MELTRDKLLDTRLVDRNVEKGLISQTEVDAHLAGLVDVADQAEVVAAEMVKIAMRNVEAKDTGENE